jgi:hypothetical membrane protein
VRPMPGRCLCFGAAAAATPLLLVLLAALLSGWFNPLTNALSDLGHATRSPVAPIFNLGLSLGASCWPSQGSSAPTGGRAWWERPW